MHGWSESTERLADSIAAYAVERLRLQPPPLDGPAEPAELARAAGATITPAGLGGEAALQLFVEVLAPACISVDHPRHLSFVPCAPTESATMFDLVVGASSVCGSSWLEGAGAVYAENQALDWLISLAGLPLQSGGVFVQGGTLANLSALVAAREAVRATLGSPPFEPPRHGGSGTVGQPGGAEDGLPGPGPAHRWALVAGTESHASIVHAARVMDVTVVPAATGGDGRLHGQGVEDALDAATSRGLAVFAVVASAGTTNLGIVDDIASIAEVTSRRRVWLHVDGAYGGAALVAPSRRALFAGLERADSFVVDPHKWLFAPYDCAALIYRDPDIGRRAHTQHAGYLDPIERGGRWNPQDYAIHLTRRARGLPFWFSLAANGTEAYRRAVERTLEVCDHAVERIEARPDLELVRRPDLSVVCFFRRGWEPADYYGWSDDLLASGEAFVTPTSVAGRPAVRFCFVNPETTEDDVDLILESTR
ncbi:MAG TPA: pyridoxal-dependent decarboxylase [Acidimicrobiales bacterium]|nr:pyridoxal-dependent decarboxylase [Acidimicrobiales bacterium]